MGVRLNDRDRVVYAAAQLGGVYRRYKRTPSGILVEYFTMGDDDVTQSVTRLERTNLLRPMDIRVGIDTLESLRALVERSPK